MLLVAIRGERQAENNIQKQFLRDLRFEGMLRDRQAIRILLW